MIQWLYEEYGMAGSLLLAFFFFIFFIFWLAALAGINNEAKYSDKKKLLMSVIGVFFPPFAVIWLLIEVYRQHRILKSGKHAIR